MKRPKLREIGEALRSLFSFAYTSRFPRVPTIPPEGFRGRPRYTSEECVGCRACAEVCPARAIDVEDIRFSGPRGLRRLTHHYDICVFCGQCEAACITEKGIKLSAEYDLAGDSRKKMTDVVEKDLLFCEVCGSAVACVDHIKWIAKKVGLVAYANPTLYLTRHKEELKVLPKISNRDERPVGRHDQLKMTCPACRRQILFTEAW